MSREVGLEAAMNENSYLRMTKKCKKCGIEKDESEFYHFYQKSKKDKSKKWEYLDSICKKCRAKYSDERRRNVKIKAIEYLGGKCADCGVEDDPCIYDFHHLDPNEKEISFGSKRSRSFESIKSELDKCVLLCANCHRKRHLKLMQVSFKE